MVTCISHSPAETEALGEKWGRTAKSGLVIGLSGDLGAGKTQLVKGLARGLGIPAGVQSPSFTLVNIYSGGRLTFFHLDLYRLETAGQILGAGLAEYLEPAGVTVIEWVERWIDGGAVSDPQPKTLRDVDFTGAPRPKLFRWAWIESTSATERRIIYEDFGS